MKQKGPPVGDPFLWIRIFLLSNVKGQLTKTDRELFYNHLPCNSFRFAGYPVEIDAGAPVGRIYGEADPIPAVVVSRF